MRLSLYQCRRLARATFSYAVRGLFRTYYRLMLSRITSGTPCLFWSDSRLMILEIVYHPSLATWPKEVLTKRSDSYPLVLC